jgi:hypothetical protein
LITGGIGFLAGGAIDLGKQLIVDQKNIAEVNWAETGGAAAAGGVAGLTMGVGTALGATGLGATVGLGALGGGLGGQAGRIAENS